MKILQLCKKFPYPIKDGESIAISSIARAFDVLGCEVTLLAMNTSKHWSDPSLFSAAHHPYTAVHTVDIDNRIRPGAALRNLFSNQSYHIERFEHQEFAQQLVALLEQNEYDVIHLETLYLAPYLPLIRRHSDALVALRAHNVEHEIWERVATNSHPLKKWYLNTITPRLKKYEVDHLNQFDLIVGITERDVEYFRHLGLQKPAVVTPIGLNCDDYPADFSSFHTLPQLSFIGSLDWMPNVEGLQWFLDEVWQPLLAPAHPGLMFHIAGRNTPAWLERLQLPGVVVHGEVPDAAAFINQSSIMVVPLLSGGGMRAKILEGMALGKVVVSTSMGMEGIPARHQQEALLADTPEAFARAIQWCLAQGPELEQTGLRARAFCREHFDNLEVGRRLVNTYQSLSATLPELV